MFKNYFKDGQKLPLFGVGPYIDSWVRNPMYSGWWIALTGEIDCPILMFESDGKQVSANWIQYQNEFAKRNNAKIMQLNCGHYVHYYESDRISEEIKKFKEAKFQIENIQRQVSGKKEEGLKKDVQGNETF